MDKPAVVGGKPVFSEMLPIIRPTLIKPEEIFADLKGIFDSGALTQGQYGERLEQAVHEYLGVKHVVAVSSCTSGLLLLVQALGLTGEVIVPGFTFTATAHSLVWNGLKPVFVDCLSENGNIDPAKIEAAITPRTSAILAVYVFGNPPQIAELSRIAGKHHLQLIFDTAQGLGSIYQGKSAGRFGRGEVFSLSPTKVLTGGEGGLVATNDSLIAEKVRCGRDYGKSSEGEDIAFAGLSARLGEFNALLAGRQISYLERWIASRNRLIKLYHDRLGRLPGITFPQVFAGNRSSGNYMVIFIDGKKFGLTRDELYLALKAENIQTKKYFYPPVHRQTAYHQYRDQTLPVTEKLSLSSLALPLYSHLTEDVLDKVCAAIERVHYYQGLGESRIQELEAKSRNIGVRSQELEFRRQG